MYGKSARHWLPFVIVLCLSARTCAGTARQQFHAASEAYRGGDFQRATSLLTAFIAQHPNNDLASVARFFLAESQMQLREYGQAYENYEAFLANVADDSSRVISAQYRLGEAAYFSQKYDLAQRALTRFVDLHPKSSYAARALPYLGDIAMASGKNAEALAWYASAVREFPSGPLSQQAHFGQARAAELDGRIGKARRYYADLIAVADGTIAEKAALQYALMEYEQRQYEVAAEQLRNFATRFAKGPRAPLADYYLGLSLIGQDELEAAITQLRSNIRQTNDPDLLAGNHFYLAEALRRRGDEEAAQLEYQRVADNWQQSNCYQKSLCQVFSHQCRHLAVDEAATQYQKIHTQLSSDNRRRARRTLALRMLTDDRYADVLELLADDQNFHTEDDWYLEAAARYGLKDFAGTLAATQHINHDFGSHYAEWGILTTAFSNLAIDEPAAALPYLQQYIAEYAGRPQVPRCRAELLVIQARTGQWEKVIHNWPTLIESFGHEKSVRRATLNLAVLAIDADRVDLAQRYFDRLVSFGQEDQITAEARLGLASLNPVPKTPVGPELPAFSDQDTVETPHDAQQRPSQPAVPEMPAVDARELLDNAAQLVAQGSLFSARDLLAEALRQPMAMTHRSAIHLALADTYQHADDHEGALQQLERLADVELQPKQQSLRCFLLARSFVATGQADLAEMQWLKIHTDWPASRYWRDASLRLAQRLLEREDYLAAEATLDRVIEADQRTPSLEHTLYTRARLAVAQEKWDEARGWMQQLWGEFPDGKLALPCRVWIGECHYRQGDLDQAESVFSELQETALHRHEVWLGMVPLRIAQISAQRENWSDVLAIAGEIESRFPGFQQQFEADHLIGRALAARGDFHEARRAYQRVIRSPHGVDSETIAMTQWLIGETYMHQQYYDRAIREYLRVEALYPYAPLWQAGGLLQAAKCYELTGDRVAAVQLYARIVEDYPKNAFTAQAIERLGAIQDRVAMADEFRSGG